MIIAFHPFADQLVRAKQEHLRDAKAESFGRPKIDQLYYPSPREGGADAKDESPPGCNRKNQFTTDFTRRHIMTMKPLLAAALFFVGAITALTGRAEAPAGSTGECKDDTYSSASSKRGACAGHGGVKEWYETKKAAAAESKVAAPPPAAASSKAAPSKSATKTVEMPTTAAAGGGPGKVWVNTSSKVYHCADDKWYGKTKKGEYMSETDAKAKGNHADHGKACD